MIPLPFQMSQRMGASTNLSLYEFACPQGQETESLLAEHSPRSLYALSEGLHLELESGSLCVHLGGPRHPRPPVLFAWLPKKGMAIGALTYLSPNPS